MLYKISLHLILLNFDNDSGISAYDVSLFMAINASIPNILPRGNRAGDFSGVVYDSATDPDCWVTLFCVPEFLQNRSLIFDTLQWTATRCNSPKLPQITRPDLTQCDTPNTWGFTLDDGEPTFFSSMTSNTQILFKTGPNCSHNAVRSLFCLELATYQSHLSSLSTVLRLSPFDRAESDLIL